MPGRRRIDTAAPLRSSIADAAFAVEERLVWGGADVLRRIVDAIKWPFERAIWAVERGVVWPLEERTDDWGVPVRTFGVVVLALLAVGAGVFGLLWASGSGGGGASHVQQAATPPAAPIVQPTAKEELKAAAPVLQGAKPDFSAASDGGVSKGAGEVASESSAAAGVTASAESAAANSTTEVASSGTGKVEPAGPAATLVARQFASAFVLYETGHLDRRVRLAFESTATPRLVHELLRRPPRLPANTTVPQAKVLNVVAGPHHGDTYTVSVSLLRVGVTSELRLDLQRDPKSGEWTVGNALG